MIGLCCSIFLIIGLAKGQLAGPVLSCPFPQTVVLLFYYLHDSECPFNPLICSIKLFAVRLQE